jgi:hypothetical protein
VCSRVVWHSVTDSLKERTVPFLFFEGRLTDGGKAVWALDNVGSSTCHNPIGLNGLLRDHLFTFFKELTSISLLYLQNLLFINLLYLLLYLLNSIKFTLLTELYR